MIWIQNQLVGAQEGQQMTLECHSEAFPKSINYWTKERGEIIAQGEHTRTQLTNSDILNADFVIFSGFCVNFISQNPM